MKITRASRLDNDELTAELSRLARCEREATAALIVHLAEFDARRLFEGPGYSSLFKYCMAVPSLRGCRLQPDQNSAGGPRLSRHHRQARERRADPHDRASPRAPPDAREPPGATSGGSWSSTTSSRTRRGDGTGPGTSAHS